MRGSSPHYRMVGSRTTRRSSQACLTASRVPGPGSTPCLPMSASRAVSWGRLTGETDAAFSARIRRNLQATSGTRAALIEVVTNFTGRTPVVFEPAYPPDTGGLGTTGLGWNTTGGWGNLNLPFQCFVTAYRPAGGGIANSGSWGSLAATTTQNLSLGGWNNGALQYGDATLIEGQITDAQIFATIANCLPAATIAWTRLSD